MDLSRLYKETRQVSLLITPDGEIYGVMVRRPLRRPIRLYRKDWHPSKFPRVLRATLSAHNFKPIEVQIGSTECRLKSFMGCGPKDLKIGVPTTGDNCND